VIRRVPITLREARAFIGAHHRHNIPPKGWLCGVAVEMDGQRIAVGVLGRPVARGAQDGRTAEITRVCTVDSHNAASMIYGALCRAAEALGYDSVISYTLEEEDGTSLRAAGFTAEEAIRARERWDYSGQSRVQTNLLGEERRPQGPKVRWRRTL
jgi:hypothetical protein